MESPHEPAPADVLDTLDAVTRLYLSDAVRVHRLVRRAVCAPPAVIEDACQFAWTALLVHRARIRADSARGWLVRVAVREAVRLVRGARRESSLEQLIEPPDQGSTEDPAPTTAVACLSTPSLMDDLLEQRTRLDAIGQLPERQQRLVWMQGLGFSYREMSGQTGLTPRTVERQLLRAKRSLAEARA